MAVITPVVGMVYGFKFKDGYNAFAGVYKVEAILTYQEYLDQNGDIFTDFYEPNNKTQSDLNKDLESLREGKILKLATVDESEDTTYYYVPSLYIESSPDYQVKQYTKFGIVAYIGVTENPEDLTYIKDNLVAQSEAALGITPKIQFMSLGKIWMTQSEYNDELAKRNTEKIKTINYFSEMKRLTTELSAANTKLAECEKLIIKLSKNQKSTKTEGE